MGASARKDGECHVQTDRNKSDDVVLDVRLVRGSEECLHGYVGVVRRRGSGPRDTARATRRRDDPACEGVWC